jgi:hypothetical protein
LAGVGFVIALTAGASPIWSLAQVPEILGKTVASMFGLLVVLGTSGMVLFATRFPFSTRIRDLELAKERACGLNGYQVWKYSWFAIIIGTLGQIIAMWLT